jgi:hypothetical protein
MGVAPALAGRGRAMGAWLRRAARRRAGR